jgi:hypothetical protein
MVIATVSFSTLLMHRMQNVELTNERVQWEIPAEASPLVAPG